MSEVVESTPKASNRKGFASDVLKLTSAATFAQALGVLTSPIVSRLYGPEAYGIANLFTSITGIIGVMACMRYELAIVLPKTENEAVNVLSISLFFVVAISFLTGLVVWLGRSVIPVWLNEPDLRHYLWLIPVNVFGSGVFLALNYWNSRTKNFGRLSFVRIIRSVGNSAILIGCGLLGYTTAGGKIGAIVVSQIIATITLAGLVWHGNGKNLFRNVSLPKVIESAKRYRKFPLYNIGAALLNNISWQLPTFILSIFFSSSVVGYYGLGNRVLRLPMNLIGSALAQVFFQRAAEAKVEGTLPVLVKSVFRSLVKLGMFPAFLLTIIGQDLFLVIYGQEWAEAGVYTQILAIWTFFWFISSPMATLYSVLEKQEFSLKINILIFVTRLISLFVGGWLRDARITLLLFGISGILVYGYLSLSILNLVGISWCAVGKILWTNFALSFPLNLILIFFKVLGVSSWLLLSLAVSIAVIYLINIIRSDPLIKNLLFGKKRLRLR